MAKNVKKVSARKTGPMPVVTNFYGTSGRVVLWTNRAYDEENAVDRAFRYMRRNEYGAFVAEVSNSETGELYAVIIHSVVGEIRAIFRRDPTTKVIVTDFDVRLVESAKGEDVDLINLILQESRLEKKIQEKVNG